MKEMARRRRNEQALDVVIKHLHIFRLWKVVGTWLGIYCIIHRLKGIVWPFGLGFETRGHVLEVAMGPRNRVGTK
jgi:hypothetical protein